MRTTYPWWVVPLALFLVAELVVHKGGVFKDGHFWRFE